MQSQHVGCKSSCRYCYFYPSYYLLSIKCTLITFDIILELIICAWKVFLSCILELRFYYCKNHISLTYSSVFICNFWVKLTYWYIVKRFFDFGSVRFHLKLTLEAYIRQRRNKKNKVMYLSQILTKFSRKNYSSKHPTE